MLMGSTFTSPPSFFDEHKENDTAHYRERYKDPEKLKVDLMAGFASEIFVWKDEIPLFKQKFNIKDDVLRSVLMEIYESAKHVGNVPISYEDSEEMLFAPKKLYNSIAWLGCCADQPARELLMRIATDDTVVKNYRVPAIMAYIQCADAQQMRDALVCFLVNTGLNAHGVYQQAIDVYDESKDDKRKREAILTTLIVLLAREGNKVIFADMDKKLAVRSKEYATSAQRLAMLQRMNGLPPFWNSGPDHDLKNELESLQSRARFTNVSTNMTELMKRDFNKRR